jgi:hypothetical protein
MAFEKKFELKLYVPEHVEVSGDMPNRWVNGLKNAAEVINDRRQAKIPDDQTFIKVMAERSSLNWRPMIDPAFWSKSDRSAKDITDHQATNLETGFNRWNDKINRAFATVDGVVAKKFKDEVEASKDRWALRVGEKVLRLTGDKIRGRSVAPIAAFYLVGDERAKAWLREGDVGAGDPYNIARTGERVALKAAIQQRLIQGGLAIITSKYNATTILNQNTVNTTLLNGLRDTAKCDPFVTTPAPDKCWCVWAMDDTFLYLHIQIGLTT